MNSVPTDGRTNMKTLVVSAAVAGHLAVFSVFGLGTAVAQEQIARDQVAYNINTSEADFYEASLDLDQLASRLRLTPAIGVWSKLQLKGTLSQILEEVDRHYDGDSDQEIETLKARFYTLADETSKKLKGADPGLSNIIASSRDAIWQALIRR